MGKAKKSTVAKRKRQRQKKLQQLDRSHRHRQHQVAHSSRCQVINSTDSPAKQTTVDHISAALENACLENQLAISNMTAELESDHATIAIETSDQVAICDGSDAIMKPEASVGVHVSEKPSPSAAVAADRLPPDYSKHTPGVVSY